MQRRRDLRDGYDISAPFNVSVCASAAFVCCWLTVLFLLSTVFFPPFLIKRSEFPRSISRREISLFFSPSVFNLIFLIHSMTSRNRRGQNCLLANCMSQKQGKEEGMLGERRDSDPSRCTQQQPFNTIRPSQPPNAAFLTLYQSVADYPIIRRLWEKRIWWTCLFRTDLYSFVGFHSMIWWLLDKGLISCSHCWRSVL